MPKSATRPYEVMIIVDADLDEETIRATVERWLQLIESHGAVRGHVDFWGKRRLAYRIKKKQEGSYFVVNFQLDSKQTKKLEQTLRLNDHILRFLIVDKAAL